MTALGTDLEPTLGSAGLTVADELFAAVDVLDGSGSLRRALTDPGRESTERAALARDLFGDKVQEATVAVLEAVASHRWSQERDLSDAVESLGVSTAAIAAESEGISGLEQVESALLGFRHVIDNSHDLQRALTDRQATAQAKQKLAARLSPEARPEARLLIDRAVTAPRGFRPAGLIEQFAEIIAARQQRWIARVTVAKELDEAYTEKLSKGLDAYFGRELKLDVVVDPSVIGGIRVQVDNEVVDSTVTTRLNTLGRRLAR